MSEITTPTPVPTPGAGATARSASARGAAADTVPPFFEENGVTVSSTRIVSYGQAFPLKDAKGVRLFIDKRHLRFAIPILIAGIVLGIYGIASQLSPAIALAVMLLAVSYLTWRFQTLRHRLFLVRDTGDTEAFVSSKLDFTYRVKAALEQAVAGLGKVAAASTTNATATSMSSSDAPPSNA